MEFMLFFKYNYLIISLFKVIVVLLLIILHVYYLLDADGDSETKFSEAGVFYKKLRETIILGIGILGSYSSYITIKNEYFKKEQINTETIQASLEKLNKNVENKYILLNDNIKNLYKLTKELENYKNKLKTSNNSSITVVEKLEENLKNYLSVLNQLVDIKKNPDNISVNDLEEKKELLIKQGLEVDTLEKFLTENQTSTIQDIINQNFSQVSNINTESNLYPEFNTSNELDINKSSTLSTLIENFDNLNGIKKLAVSLLFLNSALISSLISIVFVFYGDYLLTKYNIENRFPKLAKIIQLRKKYTRYYLVLSSIIIITVSFTEIVLCISILSL